MDDALDVEVRRLWGGEGDPPRSDSVSERVRIISAAGLVSKAQVKRLDALTLPPGQASPYAGRSNPENAAQRFLDQVRSDYRRVSPGLGLDDVEEWRLTVEGVAALREAHVANTSVGVLAVGELLDSGGPLQDLKAWVPDDVGTDGFISAFGAVLGPVVRAAMAPRASSEVPVWSPDLDSEAGRLWVHEFVGTGVARLRGDRHGLGRLKHPGELFREITEAAGGLGLRSMRRS